MAKRAKQGGAAAPEPSKQAADSQAEAAAEMTAAIASKSEKQVPNATEDKAQVQVNTDADQTEPEPEQEQEREMQTPERDDELSVISSDVSPHDSDFDFLQLNSDSLLTPSPHRRSFTGSADMELVAEPLASPPLSSRGSSAACSPSRFFKSPLVTRTRSKCKQKKSAKTPQRRTIVPIRLATPKRLLEAIDSLGQQEEKEEKAMKVSTLRTRKPSTSWALPRTPSPSSKQQLEVVRGAMKSPAVTSRKTYKVETSASLLDADDIQCVPSGLMTSPSEHDSFFSFANSLSPLIPAEEFESSFLGVRLSPLVSLSTYELPRLLPPFPEQEQHGDQTQNPTFGGTPLILKTPKNTKSRSKRGPSSAGSLAGGGISAPTSTSVSPNLFNESFPNIQASTSATPGQDERSKLGGHSVMKMKLHTSFGASPSLLDSHPSREIQAINNSLKRKKYIRRRKAEENRHQTSSNVQRKLLQTPVKTSASPRTISRSPLLPWNGQTSQTDLFKTPTPRKILAADATLMGTPSSPPVARKVIPATDPAPAMPINNTKKRKASQCASMPTSMANISGLKMRKSPLGVRQAVASAITPAKQIKREATATTPGKYSVLTPQINAVNGEGSMSAFDSSMLKTPTPIGSSTSLTLSLQSASKAPAVMAIPAQVTKKAPCNCKKSKCLKLYCECFRNGGYCDENCNCLGCSNTAATEEVRQQAIAARLEKNPNAFKSKIGATPTVVTMTPGGARRLSAVTSGGSHASPASFLSPPVQLNVHQQQQLLSAGLVPTKMHKHGCHCKKSACQKKYCECFQAGVPCGENCRCIECKNQAPRVGHANGVTATGSALGGTPSRIANELDETFVSPVLQGVRQRMRIDRETWRKDFSSPFEVSPGRERERTELQSRLLASTGSSRPSTRVRAVPFTSPYTPQVASRIGAKRYRGMSPLRGLCDEQRSSSGDPHNAGSLKVRESQQYVFGVKASNTVGKAALSAVVRSSAGAERVFVLPLFGANLPPLESGISAEIFRFLTNADLHNASLVSHLWNQVTLGDTVWDHANFTPTEANVAATRRSQKKKKLETPGMDDSSTVSSVSRSTNTKMVAIKREPNLAVLSALR